MLILIVGGSFALKEFRTVRYQIIDSQKKVDEDVMDEIRQVREKQKVDLEAELMSMNDETNDDWYNIRGPRPWENSKAYQDQQRAAIAKQEQSKTSR